MQIGRLSRQSFKGTYYLTADTHTRTPMLAGVLTEIEKRAKNKKEPQFLLDGGDYIGQSFPLSAANDVFIKFHKNNPKINMIFNVGNVETWFLIGDKNNVWNSMNKLAKNGIKFVSLTTKDVLKRENKQDDFILPYVVCEDEHEGKKEKVLITGVGEFSLVDSNNKSRMIVCDTEDIKRVIKDELLPAYEKEKPDKVILMAHCTTDKTNEALDYAKELGINNIDLVVGGHPHKIYDYEKGNTRILYPPANGKGAYIVENTVPEIKFDKFTPYANGYIYDPIAESKSTIPNIDNCHPIPIGQDYQKIFDSQKCKKLMEKLATATVALKYRNDYDFKYSEPTQLGTFIANGMRDNSNADIGLLLSMDMRERASEKGQDVTWYKIGDTLNVEHNVYKYRGIDANTLKQMLEVSFKQQDKGISNPDFFEYSDNIKVERYINAKEDEPKVKQIYIKEDGKFKPLLDENQEQLDDKKYTVATSAYVAVGKVRGNLKLFQGRDNEKDTSKMTEEELKEYQAERKEKAKKFKADKVKGVTLKNCLLSQYQKYEKEGIEEFKAAEIINVVK